MGSQRGGFAIGLVVGVLLGLAMALGVALYVTKVPQRTAEQDAAEAERNKNWNPNAPLAGNAARPAAASGPAPVAAPAPPTSPIAPPAVATVPRPSAAPAPAPMVPPAVAGPAAAAPAAPAPPAAVAVAKPLPPGADPFIYFAQAGAYTRADDAEAQRAKLALLGVDARITEREQAGRTVYRVRLGPFESREQVDAMLERLRGAGVDSSLVRATRQ